VRYPDYFICFIVFNTCRVRFDIAIRGLSKRSLSVQVDFRIQFWTYHPYQCLNLPEKMSTNFWHIFIFAGITALSIAYALQLAVDTSQYGVRQCSEVENYMTSVERVISYTHIEKEPGYANHSQPPENWPQIGQITAKNLGLVYYQGGPEILKDVSFTTHAHEKIGIVGRAGAGKSSCIGFSSLSHASTIR